MAEKCLCSASASDPSTIDIAAESISHSTDSFVPSPCCKLKKTSALYKETFGINARDMLRAYKVVCFLRVFGECRDMV